MTTFVVTLDSESEAILLHLIEVEADLGALEEEADAFTYARSVEL